MKLPVLYRDCALVRDAAALAQLKEKRTVRVQFASEEPVHRWFGEEILECTSAAVDMSRVKAGAAVLLEHSASQRVGITESGNITGSKTCEAEIRLSRTPLGDSVLAEIEDGTLRWVSVGYRVEKFQVNEDEDEYRAIRWLPLEISFVGIPADPTAKVLRNNEPEVETQVMFTRSKQHDHGARSDEGGGGAPSIHAQRDFSKDFDERGEMLHLAVHWARTHPAVIEFTEKAIKDKMNLLEFHRKMMEIVATPPKEVIYNGAKDHYGANPRRKSAGQRWVEDATVKRAMDTKQIRNLTLEIPDEFRFGDIASHGTRAVLNATTEGIAGTSGANVDAQQQFNLLGQQDLLVSDLFAQGTTSGDIVRFIQESTFTNAATAITEGSAKAESTLDLGIVNATVRKVAVWQDVTEEMMLDFAQASSFVNSRLSYMVQAREDQHLLTGSNASNQIVGILNQSGIQTLSGSVNPIDKLLFAKANVEGQAGVGFGSPSAYVMHPNNWLGVRLTKDANGQYLFGGPGYAPYGVGGFQNVGMMWGLPVVATVSMTQGTALVGAFRTGAQIFRRMGLTLKTTNSDGTKFQSNILTVLAEQRLALAVYQPNKFCAITAIPATV